MTGKTGLRHNRDFLLLQAGQLLSSTGSQAALIAYPLLVLAVTRSAFDAGVVSFARGLAMAVSALPAGIVADRLDRRHLMIAADAVQMLAVAVLAGAVATQHVAFGLIVGVAAVDGIGTSMFQACSAAALRSVVPPADIPAAVATSTGRVAAVRLVGPPFGGALFAVSRALPFVADAVSYLASSGSLLLMRTPFQDVRQGDLAPLRERMREGFAFLWHQRFLRTTTLMFGLLGVVESSLPFAFVVIATRDHWSTATIGLLLATFGLTVLVGSPLSGLVRRAFHAGVVLRLETVMWCCCGLYLVWPSAAALAIGMLPAALVIPSTDSLVHGYRIALTPDHLIGRSESMRSAFFSSVMPLGPLVTGALIAATTPRVAVSVVVGAAVTLAVWAALSPTLRHAPVMPS